MNNVQNNVQNNARNSVQNTPQGNLRPLDEALAVVRALPDRLPTEVLLCGEATGRVCAATVASPVDLPPHDGAAMDGFAVRSRDVAHASAASPILLPVGGATRCGEAAACGLPHTTWEVVAGGAIPTPYDAVIRDRDADIVTCEDSGAPCWVRVAQPVPAGSNRRTRGEDIGRELPLCREGTVIRPAHQMALAACGIERITVRAQPRVAVLSTGRELVDDWRDALAPGQVRNGNGPYLLAMLRRHGAAPRYLRTIADEADSFRQSLAWVAQHHLPLVISSGATANSRQDFVGATLDAIGATRLFRGVAIKPGWPVTLARLPGGSLFLGLPGNPASCAACFRVIALPLLRQLAGLPPEQPRAARLAAPVRRHPHKTLLLKACLAHDAGGQLRARLLPGQEAHRIAPLLTANGWVLLPPGDTPLAAGDIVATLPAEDDWLQDEQWPDANDAGTNHESDHESDHG